MTVEADRIPYHIRRCLFGIFIYFIFSPHLLYSQCISGRVHDTTARGNVSFSVVALLLPDSTLIAHVRTSYNGNFRICGRFSGNYRLLITHPGYDEYFKAITIANNDDVFLENVMLPPKSDTLPIFTIRQRARLSQVHGDTLEFNAGNVKTRINASVEEMLMRLPGVSVDQSGNITVNGKKVQRLLVDGEDLFGGDPSVVTRNFNADMIDKVQVLDKRSTQSEFTGIDDGERTKTINLTLKKNSKRGYFLKTDVGIGPEGYHNVNGLLGAFKDDRQIAALGMLANTGVTGFNGNMGALGSSLSVGGGSIDPFGAIANGGIPEVGGIGVHYANKWNGNEDHAVANYYFGEMKNRPLSTNFSRQMLPDTVFTQREVSGSLNTMYRHGFNADYDLVPDTNSAYRFSVGANTIQGNNEFNSSTTSTFNEVPINSGNNAITSETQRQNLRGDLMWKTRWGNKMKRSFSILTGFASQENKASATLYSVNSFFMSNNSLAVVDTTDQRKINEASSSFFYASLNYTEPLWKSVVLGLSYGLSLNHTQSILSTYGKEGGKYSQYIDSLSSDYQNDRLAQRVTVSLQGRSASYGYTIAADLQLLSYKQKDRLTNTQVDYPYINFAPKIEGFFNFDNYGGIKVHYSGSTQQPSISQLQPVKNNNDPLHINLGNPNLQPGFHHDFDFDMHFLRGVAINLNGNFGFATSGISTKTYTDSIGRQVSQPVNVDGARNASLYLFMNKRINSIDLDLGINTGLSYNRTVNYVNQYISQNDNYTSTGGLTLSKFVADKYNFQLNSTFSYVFSSSSINATASTHYWTQNHNATVAIFLFPMFEISTSAFYNWRQKIDNFDKKNSVILWNASLGRNFFKNQLTIRWQINDILSQAASISRNVSANQTTENTSNTIGRYWMVIATWHFVKRNRTL